MKLKKKFSTLKKIFVLCLFIAVSACVFRSTGINDYVLDMYFQYIKKDKIKKWFNNGVAEYAPENLHHASRWNYLTAQQFEEIVLDGISKMDPKIKSGNTIFELGVGVGAALKVIEKHFGEGALHFGGSDIAEKTICEAKRNFP